MRGGSGPCGPESVRALPQQRAGGRRLPQPPRPGRLRAARGERTGRGRAGGGRGVLCVEERRERRGHWGRSAPYARAPPPPPFGHSSLSILFLAFPLLPSVRPSPSLTVALPSMAFLPAALPTVIPQAAPYAVAGDHLERRRRAAEADLKVRKHDALSKERPARRHSRGQRGRKRAARPRRRRRRIGLALLTGVSELTQGVQTTSAARGGGSERRGGGERTGAREAGSRM